MMTALSRGHRGRVLVTGLGMGIVQQLLLRDPAIDTVTTLEASADVALLHQDLRWWADPRHEFVHGLVEEALPDLVNSGRFDGYVLDHWDALGPHLEEKVAFLRLLEDAVQTDRSVAMWGFWWEIEQRGSSDDPDTKRLLEAIDRCRRCGLILGDEDLDDPATNFWVARGADDKDLCDACEALVE